MRKSAMKWEDTGDPLEELWCDSLEPQEGEPPFGARHLAGLGLPGLQFGAAQRRHPSCLNTDICPLMDFSLRRTEPGRVFRVDGKTYFLQCDARERLPFEDAAFEWAYAEHFIEHITLRDAITWLVEVKRILRPGGFVRITTPDLKRYVEAYLAPDDGFFSAHRERIKEFGLPAMDTRKAWMVNQIFQFWGHRWIYDRDELLWAGEQAGFAAQGFSECAYRQGRDPEVAALDWDLRNDETIYVELTA
jgi:predicted SAM-dependent methyltransferase